MINLLQINKPEPIGVIETKFISYETLVVFSVLIIFTISNPILTRFKITFIQESGICMIIGFLLNFSATHLYPNVIRYYLKLGKLNWIFKL